ncbi:MAG TPA: aldehyde ferredoxin oxidoreductase C-terminal domain-containing protein, partial [Nitrospirota bacterium]|nr:aldehyde ferredoxin oxidoreductase C-terminal domain-containing protein [Nitrospirota bacterium]
LAAATGEEYTGQGLSKTGERIVSLERRYNKENGFVENDDLLPERFYTEAGSSGGGIDVPAIDRDRYRKELKKYYRIRKQDEE